MRISLTSGFLVVSLAGCGLFGGDDGEVEIRTDAETYAVLPDEAIELTVANRSEDPVFYICDGQVDLEELKGDTIVKSWRVHGFLECLTPVPIDVEQKEVFDLSFDEKSALGNIQDAAFNESVEYRLSVDLFWDLGFKRQLSDPERKSNRFRIIRNPVQ